MPALYTRQKAAYRLPTDNRRARPDNSRTVPVRCPKVPKTGRKTDAAAQNKSVRTKKSKPPPEQPHPGSETSSCGADLSGLVADPGEDDLLDAEDPGLIQDRGNVLPRVRSVPVLDAEHEAELGDVRHDDICHLAELAHPGGEVRTEDGVELPLVGHDRVHVDPGPLMGEVPEEPLDDVDLLEGPEEAGVEGVELYAQGLPVLVDGDHVHGEVAVREAGESARMRGEHGRGESGAFDAH